MSKPRISRGKPPLLTYYEAGFGCGFGTGTCFGYLKGDGYGYGAAMQEALGYCVEYYQVPHCGRR